MNANRVTWDELSGPVTMLGAWQIGILFEPAGGEAPGGDRFALKSGDSGDLAFYLADASGHGRKGAHFWEVFGGFFDESWERFASEPDEHTLVRFARAVNDALHEGCLEGGDSLPSLQLCLAAGWISRQGTLVFANFGLGVHVVPVTAEGSRFMAPEESFGFRLGWISSSEWPRYQRSLVIQRIPGLQRLWLASDAFFGDDHSDPEGAFRRVRELSRMITDLGIDGALSQVAKLPHAGDDATFVLVEPAGAEK